MSNGHWDSAYSTKAPTERSWTEPLPADSLRLVNESNLAKSAAIIDIGGGASHLVDELLKQDYSDITLLDISQSAIDETQKRLGNSISYICADITQWGPMSKYHLWHDRAVFHFLTTQEQQHRYFETLRTATSTGSQVIIATFAPTGPESCSGLPVQRWSQDELALFLSPLCHIVSTYETIHTTPWGSTQPFTWVHARRN